MKKVDGYPAKTLALIYEINFKTLNENQADA